MKALVVGAAGFVGPYLIDALVRENVKVYATKLSHEKFSSKSEVLDLNICDFSDVCRVIEYVKPDVIYHLAAQSSVKVSWEKPQLTAEINIVGTINLFEAVRKSSPQSKLIVIGSSEEYGDIDYNVAVKESTVPKPKNIYAATKYAQENIAEIYVKAYGMHIMPTRSFNHIGPRQTTQFVVADFCSQVAQIEKGLQEPVINVGNLNACRDFSDVRDVVKAYLKIAERGKDGEVYNVGSGNSTRIADILDLILSLSKRDVKVNVDDKKFRPIDIPEIQADISKIKELGWVPEIQLIKSVEDTLNYYREL